jgi:hypothetical protein
MGDAARLIGEWLTPLEVAKRLKIPEFDVIGMCRRGKMPGADSATGTWRIASWAVGGSAQAKARRATWVPSSDAHAGPFVYFIREGKGAVKIGVAHDVLKRITALQTANHRVLFCILSIPGGARLERQLHRRFAHLHIRGEWFWYGPELREFVQKKQRSARTSSETKEMK